MLSATPCLQHPGIGAFRCTPTRAWPGAPAGALAQARNTAMHPAVLDAFALLISGAEGSRLNPVFPRARTGRGGWPPTGESDRSSHDRGTKAAPDGRLIPITAKSVAACVGHITQSNGQRWAEPADLTLEASLVSSSYRRTRALARCWLGCVGHGILRNPNCQLKRVDYMTDHIDQLQKARDRLVETRREMGEAIATTASLSPDRASEFAAIQEAISAIDDAIRDEARHRDQEKASGSVFLSG